jgi:hypothetical protein
MLGRMAACAELGIRVLWDGTEVARAEHAMARLALEAAELVIEVDAPWHNDPPPAAPCGSTDRLWEHEVVEVFLLGAGQRYLEVELGPHGHYLVLELDGVRQPVRRCLPIQYATTRQGARWRGQARVPRGYLPVGLARANAYAIHGAGKDRRFLACFPVPGPAPDFHRLGCFGPLALG